MPAKNVDLSFVSGDTYLHEVTWVDSEGAAIDISTYTATMQVRKPASSSTVIVDLEEGDGLTNGGVTGQVDIEISPARTLVIPNGAFYDLQLEDSGGNITTLMTGRARVTAQVTK
jgi:hypothetical protein